MAQRFDQTPRETQGPADGEAPGDAGRAAEPVDPAARQGAYSDAPPVAGSTGESSAAASKNAGWMSRLADTSTGLPGRSGSMEGGAKSDDADRALWRLVGMGMEMAGCVVVFGLIGAGLDAYFQWDHVATIVGIIVAFLGGTYLMVKAAFNANK